MANISVVCLFLVAFFCCSNFSLARQLPKECSEGPTYWCKDLSQAVACGAVGHCTATVWETQKVTFDHNQVTDRVVKLFNELKDVKELINQEYLSARVTSTCQDIKLPVASKLCKHNTAHLEQYLIHVLKSKTSAETMCNIVGVCGNDKITQALSADAKKNTDGAKKTPLLGREKCTWGPSYWCTNITTGHECRATRHCVQRVWPHMVVAEDKDSICQICTDMVKQARDQLESNQTQEDLKAVFDGSCKLIPIKLVAQECMNLADQFIPDLVETLASQMNPQVVCSVAGLCNNAKIDRLLEGYNAALEHRTQCNNCHRTVASLRKRFDETSYEEFLIGLLQLCRNMDSLSDSCSMLVFKYYENIVAAAKHDLKPQSVCHLSGQCTHLYHSHNLYNFPEDAQVTDDVPCEFCEQLITHLRDVLVANTTELQFFKVLTGICKQTGNFKTECLHLVDQYYPMIYSYLISDLKPKELCALMGVCGDKPDVPIAPLIAQELTVKALPAHNRLIGADDSESIRANTKKTNVRIMGEESAAALPIERMFVTLPESKTACSFCEYFLHYVQVELSDVRTEDEIKTTVEKACKALPSSVAGQCREFVTQYGSAVVALLVQEIDPASVCPALGLCPRLGEVRRVAVNAAKSNCPLCLFAVEQLNAMLQNNRTESSIRSALEKLCTHLSQKLRGECTDFVDTYSHQLIEMLIADMNAQEICVFLKLCSDTSAHVDPLGIGRQSVVDKIDTYHARPSLRGDQNKMRKTKNPKYTLDIAGVLETNEIPDNTVNGRPQSKPGTACVVCEFVMKELDDQIKDKNNEEEVKKVLENVCKSVPKTVRQECTQFVDKYADLVVSLLAQELDADEVCRELKLCKSTSIRKMKEEILDCAVCETVVMAVKKVLSNDKTDHNIVHIVEKSCSLLPAKYYDRCHTLMEIYGDSVIHLIEDFGTKGVCQKIGLCAARSQILQMYKDNQH